MIVFLWVPLWLRCSICGATNAPLDFGLTVQWANARRGTAIEDQIGSCAWFSNMKLAIVDIASEKRQVFLGMICHVAAMLKDTSRFSISNPASSNCNFDHAERGPIPSRCVYLVVLYFIMIRASQNALSPRLPAFISVRFTLFLLL